MTQRGGDGVDRASTRRNGGRHEPPPTSHTGARRLWVGLRLTLAVVVAAVAGLLALVGMAAASDRPPVFLAAGLVVFLAATAAGVALATRKLPGDRRRRARRVGFAVGALVGVATFVVTALLPLGDPRLPPAPVAGQRSWELPTGQLQQDDKRHADRERRVGRVEHGEDRAALVEHAHHVDDVTEERHQDSEVQQRTAPSAEVSALSGVVPAAVEVNGRHAGA